MIKRTCSGKIKALVEFLVEKGIITKNEVMATFKRLDREMREKWERKYFKIKQTVQA